MQSWRRLVFHNWHLKLLSLLLAAMLWGTLASESTSEIGIEVPLEYRNVPSNTEVISNATNVVEVRLRGPAPLIREVAPHEISSVIDMADVAPGSEKIITLTPGQIRAPFGIEVVSVIPARVRVALEPTVSKSVRIIPTIEGTPAVGFVADGVMVTPEVMEVSGPASRVQPLESVVTTPIRIDGSKLNVAQTVDVDIEDPLIRMPQSTQIRIEVRIRRLQE